ncbi:MAG: MBL fold metallo-hydrolase [Desulfitobacterium sp.]|nr:MBL fold metallo-hydrolase [Desulfitobacterium sp.]
MIEQLLPNMYKIEIPLPKNPLRVTNSYFIKGKERNLLIDTGFNQEECKVAMDQAIKELDISLENTDIFITHIHGDHSGLAGYLSRPENKVYTGGYTAKSLMGDKGATLETFYYDLLRESGLEGITLLDHPGYTYASDPLEKVNIVRDGEILEVGEIKLQCIETSGHAPDHFCLYDEEQEILYSGDHILGKITPNNTIWDTPSTITRDYLGEYLSTLDKIAALKIKTIYPAHRFIIENPYQRIEELKDHHGKRLENILEILGKESMTGAQVASKMKWDLTIKSWEDFPPAQKIFATGEALAHLTHLVFENVLTKELRDGIVYYSRA